MEVTAVPKAVAMASSLLMATACRDHTTPKLVAVAACDQIGMKVRVPSSHDSGIGIENCAYSSVVASKSNVWISGWLAAEAIVASVAHPPVAEGDIPADMMGIIERPQKEAAIMLAVILLLEPA